MYGLPAGPQTYGGFASDAVNVPYADAMLVKIPDGVEPSVVASLSDNIPDAWRTVAPPLEDRPGSPVLICMGAGSIALYAIAIAQALGRGEPADSTCQSLVDRALEAGGKDNVTVVLARYSFRASPALSASVGANGAASA